ncbi:MAG: M20/M25/M40 family metallo-hydrolase [Balneolaceae bacterium]|nr:M20/M25/M40 family metallo-hydrolase [Balneolaceae bacterium]
MRFLLIAFFLLPFTMVRGQSLTADTIEELSNQYFMEGIDQLIEFLHIPNYGGNPADIENNRKWLHNVFTELEYELITMNSAGVDHLFAEKIINPDKPTILFYLQIDGQPVDSTQWNQESPFIPVLKECINDNCTEIDREKLNYGYNPDWKIFARSASDSKGPAIAFIQSLQILQDQGLEPAFNIKVIMDFQEELGSPTLPKLVERNPQIFDADALLIMDGTRPPGNLPTLTFGARGIATMKLTVFGPKNNLHSGQYGNFAPNPVFDLSRILASMKDENGKVLIPGFYDGIELSDAYKDLINRVPVDRDELLSTLGISVAEHVGDTYQEALQYPSLNVRGLRAAWTGEEVRTIIPAEAIAEIDMRLVPETPGEQQVQKVIGHIEGLGYKVLDRDPTDEERRIHDKLIKVEYRIGSLPFKTPLDSPLGDWLGDAMDHVFGEGNYYRMQNTGGSQPIAPFISTLGIPAISVRIPNPDNSIHAPNENLRLGNFKEGLMMCLGILTTAYE